MKVQNAKTLPEIYYGLHMVEGVAEYREPGKEPYRVMIRNEAIKEMNPTFAGRPVYVRHVDNVDLANLQAEADGYVVESFFNTSDGKHWCKFIVVSDHGKEHIKKGWKLSNCYTLKDYKGGGQWNGVDFAKDILRGEYDHLAIVPNPRYDSMVLTPDEFKKYNADKEAELLRLSNSKEEKINMKFFKKQKVENELDLAGTSVVLPKSGKEVTIEKLVNDADAMASDGVMANGDHHVMVGESKMKVNDLIEKHKACMNELDELKKKNVAPAEDEEAKKKALELAAHEEKELAEKKANDEKALIEKKANEEKAAKEAEEKKANGLKHFESLKNADKNKPEIVAKIDLTEDKVARGKARYGSN